VSTNVPGAQTQERKQCSVSRNNSQQSSPQSSQSACSSLRQPQRTTVTVSNSTNNAYAFKITVDGVQIDQSVVGPNKQYKKSFPLGENETKAVKVTRASVTMFDDEVTRDCLTPAPAYEVLTNCVTEQAHARLINNGDDTAKMAIQYGEGTYAHQAIGAHSSKDWLLTVNPNESVQFHVVHDSTILGTEDLFFDCPVVEPPVVEPPVVEPPVTEPPVVEPPVTEPETAGGADTDGPAKTPGPDETTTEDETTNEDETTDDAAAGEEDNTDEQDTVDTEVLGEQIAIDDISEIGESGDLDELVGEVAGPTVANGVVGTDAGMGFMKMALIAVWVLVIAAAGLVAVLINRRRANES